MESAKSTSPYAYWQARRSDVIHRSLDDLLAMANRYRREGRVWQAMDMYWMLLEDHWGTAQSLEAEKNLLELAEAYERDDARHLARGVYERLSNLGRTITGTIVAERAAIVVAQEAARAR